MYERTLYRSGNATVISIPTHHLAALELEPGSRVALKLDWPLRQLVILPPGHPSNPFTIPTSTSKH